MKPEDVKSSNWTDYEIIFNDGDYSAIWGKYRSDPKKCLGIRWNEAYAGIGYPNGKGGKPEWLVMPDFVDTFLEKLFTVSIKDDLKNDKGEAYSEKIKNAIKEYQN